VGSTQCILAAGQRICLEFPACRFKGLSEESFDLRSHLQQHQGTIGFSESGFCETLTISATLLRFRS